MKQIIKDFCMRLSASMRTPADANWSLADQAELDHIDGNITTEARDDITSGVADR
jgi:hypothetical protein